ncbi:MAG: hypothetical protein EB120_00605 [Proteobacteria bacterium]|nr:hypothetical protein [Pseudomonadota bacterium]
MEIPKVILYYKFTPLSDPAAIRIWQKNLCESLNLKGRIIISPHGIKRYCDAIWCQDHEKS